MSLVIDFFLGNEFFLAEDDLFQLLQVVQYCTQTRIGITVVKDFQEIFQFGEAALACLVEFVAQFL